MLDNHFSFNNIKQESIIVLQKDNRERERDLKKSVIALVVD